MHAMLQARGAMNSSNRSRGWCNMLPEILDLVVHRLSLPDRFRFGWVCSPWRSVLLASKLCCPARPPPWMVTFHVRNPNSGTLMGFVDGSQLLKLCSPMPTFLPDEQIIGSSSGWLLIASNWKCRLRLLNPTSNQQILLPCTTTDGTSIWHNKEITSAALSSSPTSDNCVLVLQGFLGDDTDQGHLAYFRLGRDQAWTAFTDSRIHGWNPMIFHNGELIIIVTGGDGILIFNFDFQPNLRAFCTAPVPTGWTRLVSSGVELFLVVLPFSIDPVLTCKLEVYKLVMDGIGSWVRVESLGDRVLLIGRHGAESFCTQGLLGTGFESNCIYNSSFTLKPYSCLTKFSMADGSMEIINHPRLSHGLRGFEWIVAPKHAR